MNVPMLHTAELSDAHPTAVAVDPIFRDFGGRCHFAGPIRTVRLFEDNSLVRSALEQKGHGVVLVVDGGGSRRCALLGDILGELAVKNGWAGLIIHGCVRDTEALARLDLGVKALAPHPRKSVTRGGGDRDVPVEFGAATFSPGCFLYADPDGILISSDELRQAAARKA